MRELYLDDIPLGSSNENNYENFLGRKFRRPMVMGRPIKGLPPKRFPVSEIEVKTVEPVKGTQTEIGQSQVSEPVLPQSPFDAKGKYRVIKNIIGHSYSDSDNVFPPSVVLSIGDIIEAKDGIPTYRFGKWYLNFKINNRIVYIPFDSLELVQESQSVPVKGTKMRKMPFRIGNMFSKRVKRPNAEIRLITYRARQIWNKDMESWSEALKRAEKQLVQEGGVTPATFINFDGSGNAVGYEHITYDEISDDDNSETSEEDYMENTEDYSG